MKPRLSLLILFSLMIPPSAVFAQPSPTLQAQREAMAMVTYDTESEKYHFNTQVHRGGTGQYQGRVEDGAFIWEMPFGGARMRYIIRIDDEGRWHEIGQRSDDGQNWTQFFEMTLARVE